MKQLPVKSPSFLYVEQSFKEWLDILGYSGHTVYNLPHHVRELFHYLETTEQLTGITQLKPIHIKRYYQQLRERSNRRRGGALSAAYLNKHLQALNKLLDYLRQSGRLPFDQLAIRFEETTPSEPDILTHAEIQLLYKATEQITPGSLSEALAARDKTLLTIFYGCGLRRSEGSRLSVSDISFDQGLLHVRHGKGYKERFVPFNKAASKLLEHYIYDHRPRLLGARKSDALFIGRGGKSMGAQSLYIRLKLLLLKTEDPQLQQKAISLHTLRHSIATHLLEAGMSLEHIARFLGHSSLESTQIYTHLSEALRSVSESAQPNSSRQQRSGSSGSALTTNY